MGLFGTVMLTSALACAVTTIGILVIVRHAPWASRNAVYFVSFAAGVLISVSFIHIVPTCFAMNDRSPVFPLAGFMGMHLISRFISTYVRHQRECPDLVEEIEAPRSPSRLSGLRLRGPAGPGRGSGRDGHGWR